MELVGFNTVSTDSAIGLFAMTALCQADFADSRMCTSKEIMETVNIPYDLPNALAWVQPVVVSSRDGNGNPDKYTDISGLTAPYSLNCDNWTKSDYANTSRGMVIDPSGKFHGVVCEGHTYLVACCAPAQ